MKIRASSVRACACGFVFFLAVRFACASVGGSISGLVTDPSGAVIAGAEVVALNTETSIQHTVKTDTSGFYSFPTLPIGHYQIEIRATGFKSFRETDSVIDANTALHVDAKLELGAVTEAVSISATAVHVETTNTQMGEVIGSSRITTVPLNGRGYTDLLALQPGVVPVSSGEYGNYNSPPDVSGDLNPGHLSISGQREAANGFMVNGGNVQEGIEMGTAVIPNLDSIAEFRILTNNADAEYGNYAGGLVNAITKSGTNQFHGDAFEFLRNTNLDSRNFYDYNQINPLTGAEIPGSAIAAFHQNQFGGTLGGPILRDKLFFFTDYQGTRTVVGIDSGLIPVPSIADKAGNLSDQTAALVQANAAVNGAYWANTLSQELGYPVATGEPYFTYTPPTPPGSPPAQPTLCTSSAQNCVFPNAVIPQSAFSAPTKNLLQYIPSPNVGSNFSTSAFKQTLHDNKGSGRLDANTRLGMLSGYYFIDDFALINPYGGANVPGFATDNGGRAQMMNFSSTKSFGPSSVNELRLQYMRNIVLVGTPVGGLGVSLASQGFEVGPTTPGIVVLAPQIEGVESVGFNNFGIGVTSDTNQRHENIYQVLDNFSKVKGTHTLKFGASFHYDQITYYQNIQNNGTFSFNGGETGVDFADFLIGAPNSYVQGQELPMYNRSRYYGVYGQDSWRASSNLTLNYGLRWEVSTPWWEAHNQIEALVPGLQSVVFPGAPAGWDFPGDPGVSSTLAPTRHNNFAPRIGIAYSPATTGGFLGKLLGGPGKTSLRAAFGVYFTAFENVESINASGDAPYGNYYVSPTPPLFATPFIDRGTGNDEGQRFPVPVPPLNAGPQHPDNSIDWSQFLPISSSPATFTQNRLPYAEDYNVSIQRQFGAATVLGVSYVGTQAHRLIADLEANPSNPALCLSVNQQSQVQPNTPICEPFGETGSFYPITGGVINNVREPFGSSFGSDGWFATMANSNYNALEVTFRHTSGPLDFLAGYTYSKSLDNASGWGGGQGDMINPLNYKATKSLSAFDLTNNFVLSYSYRLPFARLWRSNRLTDGWMVTGITRFSTGLPPYLSEPDDMSLLGTPYSGPNGNGIDEPNYTPGNLGFINPRKADPSTDTNPYFNKSLFSLETLGQLGNASRRFFHGPGLNNWDFALLKDLHLTESKSLQFRAEFFNLYNHAQFGEPQGSILNSDFGFVTSANSPRIGQVAIKFLF